MTLRTLAASLLVALPLVGGCRNDETIAAPNLQNNQGLLARYVAMGNSITAGVQSAGINDSTQRRSYAAVFARQAGAPYFYASLRMPGCVAPFTSNVTQARVGSASATGCALRAPDQYPFLSNVAVPGAKAIDALSNTDAASAPNTLTSIILGGRTQVQAMQDARPTFVTVWLGNNDLLGALTSTTNPGDPALVTPQAAFEAAYSAILDSVAGTEAKAVLIGVLDVSLIPFSSTGTLYYCLKNGCPGVTKNAAIPASFTVNANCAPNAAGGIGDNTLVPWTVGVARILRAAQGVAGQGINCATDSEVITPTELANLKSAVAGYNAFIVAQATARQWGYMDAPAMLAAYRAAGAVPPFPALPATATASVNFGTLFSLDGIHPSTAAHRIIADSLIAVTNRTYGTSIPIAGP